MPSARGREQESVTHQNKTPTTTKRSRKGCPECRRRKIKCDERQGRCGQCQKSGRTCRIQDAVFRQHALSFLTERGLPSSTQPEESRPDEDVSIENRSNVESTTGQGSDQEMEGYQPIEPYFDQDATATVYEQPLDIAPESPVGTVLQLQELPVNHSSSQSQHTYQVTDVPSFSPDSALQANTGFHFVQPASPASYRASQPQNRVSITRGDVVISPSAVSQAPTHLSNTTTSGRIENQDRNQLEERFFLRLFNEGVGQWMDIPVNQHFFSQELCKLAREHDLLCYSICAVAAKRAGQLGDTVAQTLRSRGQRKTAQILLKRDRDYLWYGAKYHGKALQLLARRLLRNDAPSLNTSPAGSIHTGSGVQLLRIEDEDPVVGLLTICMLTQYEHLNATMRAWWGHLNGFNKLLQVIDNGALLQLRPIAHDAYPFVSQLSSVQAAFWYFVIHDLDESYVSQQRTRVDVSNIAMWRNFGLLLDDEGILVTDPASQGFPSISHRALEEMTYFSLIRLLCKIVNHQASLSPPTSGSTPLRPDASPGNVETIGTFALLEAEFDRWVEALPIPSQPDSKWRDDGYPVNDQSSKIGQETWYQDSLQATMMMYYHMARILLLSQRPIELSLEQRPSSRWHTQLDLVHVFRNIERQMYNHAAEVVSIVTGMPHDAVRSRAVQPLFAAGRCLAEKSDRCVVIETLRSVQDDLGLATEYRVKHLLQEWDTNCEDLGLESRPAERGSLTTFGDYSREILALEALHTTSTGRLSQPID